MGLSNAWGYRGLTGKWSTEWPSHVLAVAIPHLALSSRFSVGLDSLLSLCVLGGLGGEALKQGHNSSKTPHCDTRRRGASRPLPKDPARHRHACAACP